MIELIYPNTATNPQQSKELVFLAISNKDADTGTVKSTNN